MKITKKVIGSLEKCYSLSELYYNDKQHFLVAAEKVNKCLLFDKDGNLEETVWEGPGGTMSIVPLEDRNGEFLATHEFYSPNDSKEAKIIRAIPKGKDNWEIKTLVEVPFVHRFDILQKNGVKYLFVCALKSGHNCKDDWSMPGKVFFAVLPENLDDYDEKKQLPLKELKSGMLKNHGYYKHQDEVGESAIVSCEQGVYQFIPPMESDGEWEIKQLIDTPASDAVMLDLDNDGEEELFVFAPFHGDTCSIYKKHKDSYQLDYEYPEKLDFLHALYGGKLWGKSRVIVGNRQGEKKLLSFSVDEKGKYEVEELDSGYGAANVMVYRKNQEDILVAANRETDEIAMYTLD
ncbi:hypothetical protein CS063_14590 [Sporanaerobium hydrogeniformans]|uniref:Uncharacterized protein n=1 Tax=Sporanaerobium hydrogeniformans TaxID=3072179 RepID=A0AC61DAS9_9FIRM|nr:hypothetical protein [Sporanaerobium hydrogeniformans]PHV69647.1 hypothetical protein CS063_14590 [Sporanaerobium hydrogeniformans]